MPGLGGFGGMPGLGQPGLGQLQQPGLGGMGLSKQPTAAAPLGSNGGRAPLPPPPKKADPFADLLG